MVEVAIIRATSEEAEETYALAQQLLAGQSSTPVQRAWREAQLMAGNLPYRIKQAAYELRVLELHHAAILRMPLEVIDAIGNPPADHRAPGQLEMAFVPDVIQLMIAALFGTPFTWDSIQNGYLFNDVIPVPGYESEASSRSSSVKFGLHTEDSFSVYAGAFLVLQCRNNDARAATTLASYDNIRITDSAYDPLCESAFRILPNTAHQGIAKIPQLPILYGSRDRPYFRINQAAPIHCPKANRSALIEFTQMLESNTTEVILEPGDHLVIDNQRTAHGRTKFSEDAPHSRWLRRLYITDNLRASRRLRSEVDSWIIRSE